MKCIHCNTELKEGAIFCPNCGKEVTEMNVCINCGEYIKSGAPFCPHCGANQHEEQVETESPKPEVKQIVEQPKEDVQIEQQETLQETQREESTDTPIIYEEKKSKKGIWIILTILLLCAIAGAGYYFFDKGNGNDSYVSASDTIAVDDDSAEYDIHSVEGVEARLNEIFTQALNMSDDAIVNNYFSEEFRALYKKVDEVDSNSGDEIGFWQGNILDGSQETMTGFKIGKVYNLSDKTANADVSTVYDYENSHSEYVQHYVLVFENGNWFIDENNDWHFKESMKEYINESETTSGNTTISDGTYSMAGKVSKYGIHMNFEISGSDVNGYYYYDSQGSGNTVKLSGSIKENGELTLKKFSNDGEETGYFEGLFNGIEYSGKNVNYNREEDLQFKVAIEQ